MISPTKNKIIEFSIQCFNEEGYASITLQELAKRLGISRGNLAYHFKDKEVLLEAISNRMWDKLEQEQRKVRQFPSFENLKNKGIIFRDLQKEFAFIFQDQLMLRHPLISEKIKKIAEQSIEDNKTIIAYSIRLGNMKPEPFKGLYNHIAFITWTLPFFWLSQQVLQEEKSAEETERMMWSLLLPHFTEKGIQAFIQFFGQEYLDSLGEAFEPESISMNF